MSRQRLTLGGEQKQKALDDDTFLSDAGVNDGGELFVKDLGAQIGWRTVYVVEYVSFNGVQARCETPLHLLTFFGLRLDLSFYTRSSTGSRVCSMVGPSNTVKCKSGECQILTYPCLTLHGRFAYALVMLHFLKRELETLLCVRSL